MHTNSSRMFLLNRPQEGNRSNPVWAPLPHHYNNLILLFGWKGNRKAAQHFSEVFKTDRNRRKLLQYNTYLNSDTCSTWRHLQNTVCESNRSDPATELLLKSQHILHENTWHSSVVSVDGYCVDVPLSHMQAWMLAVVMLWSVAGHQAIGHCRIWLTTKVVCPHTSLYIYSLLSFSGF